MVIKADTKMDSLEKNFDLLMNASGDIMVVFGAVSGKPENAELIYDGRKRAFLRKNKEAVVPFFPIPEEVPLPTLLLSFLEPSTTLNSFNFIILTTPLQFYL